MRPRGGVRLICYAIGDVETEWNISEAFSKSGYSDFYTCENVKPEKKRKEM